MAFPRHPWRRWHRWLGLVLLPTVVALAATGILLNHADALSLGERTLPRALASLYGLPEARPVRGSPVGHRWWLHTDGRLHPPEAPPLPCAEPFLGVVEGAEGVAAGCGDALVLLDEAGIERERLDPAWGLPVFEGLGVGRHGGLVLLTPRGALALDPGSLQTSPAAPGWRRAVTLPAPAAQAARVQGSVPAELNWERLLLDIHSGRVLGVAGWLLLDLGGVLMLVLATTGTVIWLRARPGSR